MQKTKITFYMTGAYARILQHLPLVLPDLLSTAFCPNLVAYNVCVNSKVFEEVEYLYEHFNTKFNSIDEENVSEKFHKINFAEVLYTDKSHYKRKSSRYQKKIVLTMAVIVQEWFDKIKPDYIFFPIIESIDAMLTYRLAQSNGIKTICYAHGRHINVSFFSELHTEVLPSYYKLLPLINDNIKKAESFVKEFKRHPSQLNYFSKVDDFEGESYEDIEKATAFERLLSNIYLKLTTEKHNQTLSLWVKFQVYIEKILIPVQKIIYLFIEKFYIQPDKKLPKSYDYFPLHFAPESSINTPAPFYIDQLRVIDKILLERKGTPPLVIKEHPAMFSKRPISFYRKVKKIPFVQFAKQGSSSIQLLKSANTVYSVTGTVCLEAFLLGIGWKQFGDNYLNSWIKDRNSAGKSINPIEFVNDVLNVSGDFQLYSPVRNSKRNEILFSKKNIQNMAKHLVWHIDKLNTK